MQTDLVVQGRHLDDAQIAKLASLCGAVQSRRLGPGAARIAAVRRDDPTEGEFAAMQLDYAYVPSGRKLPDFGLVAMDMDSTLISIECIDELADIAGIRAQVADITSSAMRGEIGFAESLTRRVALLAGLDSAALQRVYDERLELSPGAERLIAGLKARGIKTQLVSGGFTFFTERLRKRLGLDYSCSTEPEMAGGKLTGRFAGPILDAKGKADNLIAVRNALGLAHDQVIAIGDGANDLPMLAEAGVSIAYHAKPVVRKQATYSFNHVGLDGLLNLFL